MEHLHILQVLYVLFLMDTSGWKEGFHWVTTGISRSDTTDFFLWDAVKDNVYMKETINMKQLQEYTEETLCYLDENTELCKNVVDSDERIKLCVNPECENLHKTVRK